MEDAIACHYSVVKSQCGEEAARVMTMLFMRMTSLVQFNCSIG